MWKGHIYQELVEGFVFGNWSWSWLRSLWTSRNGAIFPLLDLSMILLICVYSRCTCLVCQRFSFCLGLSTIFFVRKFQNTWFPFVFFLDFAFVDKCTVSIGLCWSIDQVAKPWWYSFTFATNCCSHGYVCHTDYSEPTITEAEICSQMWNCKMYSDSLV